MGSLSRLPNSNDPPRAAWRYGPVERLDDFAALVNDIAERCVFCRRVTMNRHLANGACPECYERATLATPPI
jgi:hypothetical protein